MSVAKICVKCQKDVSQEKRVKDPQGRYYCASCYQAGSTASSAPAQESAEDLTAAIDRELDLAPAPVERKAPAPAVSYKNALHAGGPECPCCNTAIPRDGKICIGCGIQVPSGRPVITALARDEDMLYATAERVINWISWVLRLGLYPIASEAYAIKKPIAIWIFAALTTLTSTWFYFAMHAESPSRQVTQLMLWPRPGAMRNYEVLRLYHRYYEPTPAGALIRQHADNPREPWAGKSLDERLAAAIRDLGLENGGGEFRWYQLLTNTFLHDFGSVGGLIMHLGGNMLFLLIFGTRVNALVGNLKMTILYPVLGILASTAELLFSPHDIARPALGASGAIMGLAGMYLVFFPVHRVHMAFWWRFWWFSPPRIKIWAMRGFWVLGFYIAFDVLGTFLQSRDGVAHWAHLGGFIAGILIALGLLVARAQDARHNDLLSVMLGKAAWPLIGKPVPLARAEVVG